MLDPGDPVGLGLVASLARPGGNITGVSSIAPELAAKRLALLKEAVPAMVRLLSFRTPRFRRRNRDAGTASGGYGPRCADPIGSDPGRQGYRAGVRRSCAPACRWNRPFPDPLTFSNEAAIIGFRAENRIPVLYGAMEFVQAGGLMSYGPSYPEMFRIGANYVDRILKGAKPGDLPIEQPTRFEFALNLKTANALGLTIRSRSCCAPTGDRVDAVVPIR
jgi:putative ABC transport system substrate-binding protein